MLLAKKTFSKSYLVTILFFFGTTFTASAVEKTKPINLSLVPDIAIYKRTQKIEGFTLSIWGENETRGLGIGIVNGTRGDSVGLSWGIVNYADKFTGAQIGAVNWAKKNFVGFQGGLVNCAVGPMTGFQWGAVNYAEKMKGLQLGFVNYAQTAESGVQVGFVNVIPETKGFFTEFPKTVAPFMILANWRFK